MIIDCNSSKKYSYIKLLFVTISSFFLVACSEDPNQLDSSIDNVVYEVAEGDESESDIITDTTERIISADDLDTDDSVTNGQTNENEEDGHITSNKDLDNNEDAILEGEENGVDLEEYHITLSFAGDINFDEKWSTMEYYKNKASNNISNCISPSLIQMMNNSDAMMLNNEFTYSLRGSPLEGKEYTFRAKPSRVNILKELGVDIVNLANNHVYDYGPEALVDTMDTLAAADILYFGAGGNIKEAMSPIYINVQGKTIAYVGASRAEKYPMTPQATENSPGILRCYDTELFIEAIKNANQKADYVVASVHWGTEYSQELEDVQLETSKEYINAGADIIIGSHPHILQGIEFYKGKPIIYSLGNFWFNSKTVDSMLLNLHLYGNSYEDNVEVEIVPAIQSDHVTKLITLPEEKERFYSDLEDISINVEINNKGIVTEIDEFKEYKE